MVIPVQAAELLPWPDLTRTTLAELRFNSFARFLPDDESSASPRRHATSI